MRLPENLKEILRRMTPDSVTAPGEEEDRGLVTSELPRPREEGEEEEEEIHSLPAGVWPKQGPRPGMLGTVLYYISLALSVIGILTMLRCTYIQESARPQVLLVGFCLIISGLLCLNLANFFYNREQRTLVEYLQGKISEMMLEHRTRTRDVV